MHGLMQDWPLLTHRIIDHAASFHGTREIVSRSVEGPIVRHTYSELNAGARKMASALSGLGIKKGDIIGTMAWNGYRHMELWYGAMGLGAVVHTLNPRLFPEQLVYIINHAEDGYFFLDLTFVPILEGIQDRLKTVKGFIIMTDEAHMPDTSLRNAQCYETLKAGGDDGFQWPEFDEKTAAGMCYTSGTTGNPKGVLYSHKSNVLHALSSSSADALALSSVETILPVVPMFHANSWALVFAGPMTGASLVMPGAAMDGPSIYELLDTEKVTLTAAVPTVWQMLLMHLEETGKTLPHLKRVVIGGAACPPSMMDIFEDKYDVEVIHAWGMTEMSPLGSLCTRKGGLEDMPDKAWRAIQRKQGRPPFSIEMKIVDDAGEELPWDGKSFGHLLVRGPCVSSAYFKGEGGDILDKDGWFDTGDVSTIDEHGYMEITDRSKDVIKSGGEWISSIELENLAVGHRDVIEAAVIGVAHPKWDERPLLIIVRKEGSKVSREDLLEFLDGQIAKWWMPDDVVFVDEIPHTATGKIQKTALREQFADYRLPSADAAE